MTPSEKDCTLRPMKELTDRQRDVLSLVGSGHSTEEIAALLGVHPNTIKGDVLQLKAKLGVTKRRHLAAVARDHA